MDCVTTVYSQVCHQRSGGVVGVPYAPIYCGMCLTKHVLEVWKS